MKKVFVSAGQKTAQRWILSNIVSMTVSEPDNKGIRRVILHKENGEVSSGPLYPEEYLQMTVKEVTD